MEDMRERLEAARELLKDFDEDTQHKKVETLHEGMAKMLTMLMMLNEHTSVSKIYSQIREQLEIEILRTEKRLKKED